ncbi:MAG: hypothetical protein MI784_01105 [Cytophagales bacterium]|nr:hypothetical protein [Cytophagales bacterium]
MLHLKPLTSYLPLLDQEKVAFDLRFGECRLIDSGQRKDFVLNRLHQDHIVCRHVQEGIVASVRKSTSSRELVLWVRNWEDYRAVACLLETIGFLSRHPNYQGVVHAVFGEWPDAREFRSGAVMGVMEIGFCSSEYMLTLHAAKLSKDMLLFKHAAKIAETLVGLAEFHVGADEGLLCIPFYQENALPYVHLEIAEHLPNAVVNNVKVLVALVQVELSDWNL